MQFNKKFIELYQDLIEELLKLEVLEEFEERLIENSNNSIEIFTFNSSFFAKHILLIFEKLLLSGLSFSIYKIPSLNNETNYIVDKWTIFLKFNPNKTEIQEDVPSIYMKDDDRVGVCIEELFRREGINIHKEEYGWSYNYNALGLIISIKDDKFSDCETKIKMIKLVFSDDNIFILKLSSDPYYNKDIIIQFL